MLGESVTYQGKTLVSPKGKQIQQILSVYALFSNKMVGSALQNNYY